MPLSRMRNILEIDEILRTFLRYCDKRTLTCLARTGKVVSDPALDVLWENLETFAHLLKTFPVELITWTPTNGTLKPVVNHLIVPRDWKRFSLYSRRVRTWAAEDLSYIEEPVVDHIAFGRNPDYILPRLTHMEVTATSVSGIHLQTLLLCPSLESVSIWNSDPNQWVTRAMSTFFRTLVDRVPKLNKLIVHWGDGAAVTPHFIDGLSEVFSPEMTELRSVNLWTPNCVDANGFARLSRLRSLTTLHLNLIGSTSSLISEITDASAAFPSLQNLFLAGEMDGFHNVLKCLGNTSPTVNLGFSVREYPKARELRRLFEVVASKLRSLRLLQFNVPKQEINVQLANGQYHSSPELYYHDMGVLQPLLAIRNLAAVHLELGVPLYLNDVDLCTLGTAWPTIEVLNLCSDPYCERTRAVRPIGTVVGLFAIAELCPSLQHLGVFIDCSLGITESMVASSSVASHSLINLDVGRSRIGRPALVAALLSGVFPNLKVFQWTGMDTSEVVEAGSEEEGLASAWRQVFDLLPVFRAVRANERKETRPEVDWSDIAVSRSPEEERGMRAGMVVD